MTDPVHPVSLWGTGAPFVIDGKMQSHPAAPEPAEGQRVYRTVVRDEDGIWVVAASKRTGGFFVGYDLLLTRPNPDMVLVLEVMES